MKAILCTHKQTKERQILPEKDAMELDIRLWIKEVWYTATQPGTFKYPNPTPCAAGKPDFGVPLGLVCPVRKCFTLQPLYLEEE